MNRPAMLRLLDGKGREFYAALTGAEGERATLTFKEGSGQVDFKWFGSYTLLWKPPPGYSRPVRPGQRSPVIEWLRERLGKTSAQDAFGAGDRYDVALVERVRAFQEVKGLEVDGIIGPWTLIKVNTDAHVGAPVLVPAGEES